MSEQDVRKRNEVLEDMLRKAIVKLEELHEEKAKIFCECCDGHGCRTTSLIYRLKRVLDGKDE